METILTEKYEHLTFTLEFISSRPLRQYYKGKSWPITTQCVIKRDGWIIGIGEVVKHNKDIDNSVYARKASAKKAFIAADRRIWREVREMFWKQMLSETKQN